MGQWVEPDVRDNVVDYVRHWSERAAVTILRIIDWIGIGKSKFHGWQRRYGPTRQNP